MRQGGNKLVNGLFEANLTEKQRGVVRPNNRTDLKSRSSYIFDKYQHRKFFSKDSYEAFRPRDKIDAALSSLRSQKKNSEMEDDFFSARAKGSTNGGERFAAKSSDENEWWKTGGAASNGTPVSKRSGMLSPGDSATPNSGKRLNLGDRRNLMSTLQRMESKSLDEVNHLDTDDGKIKPSQLKSKTKTAKNRRQDKGNSFGGAISPTAKEVDRDSAAMLRSTRQKRGVARGNSSGSGSSDDGSRKPRSSRERISRAKSFDEGLCASVASLSKSVRSSSVKRSRVRKTNSDRRPQSSKSLQGSGNFLADISASLADINANVAGDDDASSRRAGRHRPPRRGSVGSSSVLVGDGEEEESQVSRRTYRDDQSQVSSSRRTNRSSTKNDDQRQLNTNRRERQTRSPKRRDLSSHRPPSTSRTPSPDLIGNHKTSSPIGLGTKTSPRSFKQGAPISIQRVVKDRKPRIPGHSGTGVSPRTPRKLNAKVTEDMSKLFAASR